MTINERFFKLLDEKKVSQKDFCEATGIPKQTVSGWKNRKTDPPASLIPTIAAYFGITSDFLLTGKDECNQADLDHFFMLLYILSAFTTLLDCLPAIKKGPRQLTDRLFFGSH